MICQDPPRKPSEEAPPSAPPPRASAEAPAAENKTTAEATAGEVDEAWGSRGDQTCGTLW